MTTTNTPDLRKALELAEAALSDIGDANREPGDDLARCEARAAKDLPAIRAALAASHGQAPVSKIMGLTAAQESLGVEFEKVLHDNLFDLYEESPHTARLEPARADSVTAPAGGETYHLGACIVDGVLSATVLRKDRGCSGDVTVLLSEQIPVDQLRDRDVICHSTAGQPVAEPAKSISHGQAPASVLHLVHSAFAEIAMAFPKAFALHKVGIADTAVREALAAPVPPPECETEAEKRAFAFGWFKALESERMKADNKKKDTL